MTPPVPSPEPSAELRENAVRLFPRPPSAQGAVFSESTPGPEGMSGPLAQRIIDAAVVSRRGTSRPYVIASELVTALIVDLPKASARQRTALLTFAVEERVGVPIDTVVVVAARLGDPAARPNAQLAIIVSRATLTAAAATTPGARILPDFLALRRPDASAGPAWAVWRDGARVVVRRSDGTGFAAATDALAALWARAGRPILLSLGAALPSGLPATDLSDAPPAPDPLDLAFSFRLDGGSEVSTATRRTLAMAAVIVLATLVLHLGLAAADAVALGRIATSERALAEAALAPILPGVALGHDPAAILARLAPAEPQARRSDFLPLLTETSATLAESGRAITFRRLAWGAKDGTLVLLVQAPALDDLQAVEQALRDAGLAVTSGAASAGDGGAEVELRLSRAAAG